MDVDGFGQASKNNGQKPEMMNQKMVIKWNIVQFALFISNPRFNVSFPRYIYNFTHTHISHHKLNMSSPTTEHRNYNPSLNHRSQGAILH